MPLLPADLKVLAVAKQILEHPTLAIRIAAVLGAPIDLGMSRLPAQLRTKVHRITERSLLKALDFVMLTMKVADARPPANRWHKLTGAASGALGGAFGLPALAIELPISTMIILRSIADIARSEGEDLGKPLARLHCLEVLALGGRTPGDDAAETGYFAIRSALAAAISEAAAHIASKGLSRPGAPIVIRILAPIVSRFSVVVSEKVAAQAVPILGAIGGGAINTIFMDHFQRMAKGHFSVRRLERVHGEEEVRRAYERL